MLHCLVLFVQLFVVVQFNCAVFNLFGLVSMYCYFVSLRLHCLVKFHCAVLLFS